ncbi:hypothetical protein K493DRAFT_304804 [Basidiobolus meristosporus CBS 931.73]|uniref:C2H2-type domain-containing protein n=1 Tax=Basidiobolus meristosporus CBS 931.73 TaxID=1314790 RepID=A0A1Y1XXN4_9FUNG|nr:hypothetical protein K493DRAFT_306882 [Basidiobolus meristosporus CBS 931.73]ORX90508.1 hypothetical protein K493DRAFT_304804 [Basidiobolus meristosporus CBS 931.73]|eukprot:ORX87519.1 hypothetical protein K493DRAFT_306882 [Basidiobolus meristosporus CBS 931.73]
MIAAGMDSASIKATLDNANSCSTKCKSCKSGCKSRSETADHREPTHSQPNIALPSNTSCCSSAKNKEPSEARPNNGLTKKVEPTVGQNDTTITSTQPPSCCSRKKESQEEPPSASEVETTKIDPKKSERAKLITSLQQSVRKQETNHKIALESLMNPCRCGEGYGCTCLSIPDKYTFFAEFVGTGIDMEALELNLQCGSSCGVKCKSCSTKCCGKSSKPPNNINPTLDTNESDCTSADKLPHPPLDQDPIAHGSSNDQAMNSNPTYPKRSAKEANLDDLDSVDNSRLIQMVYNSVQPGKTCCQPQDEIGQPSKKPKVEAAPVKNCCASRSDDKDSKKDTVASNSCCGGSDKKNSSGCSCCFDPENPTFYTDTDGIRTCGCGCNKPALDCSHCLKDLCEEIILKPPSSCRVSHSLGE